jgi:membrane protein
MVEIYLKKRVPRSAAALSYYLMLSVFPMLICANAILSTFNITESSVLEMFHGILPDTVISTIGGYLEYVNANQSTFMVTTAIVVMVFSASAAFRSLLHIMEDIQGQTRFNGFFSAVFSFIVAFIFLIVIYASALIVASGRWLLALLNRYFDLGAMGEFWQWIRFAFLFVLMLMVIYALYRIAAPREKPRTQRIIGALAASFALVIVSIAFSAMITQSVKYPLIYGSLASLIIIMVWLYMCGIIVIMGNALNIVINRYRRKKRVIK